MRNLIRGYALNTFILLCISINISFSQLTVVTNPQDASVTCSEEARTNIRLWLLNRGALSPGDGFSVSGSSGPDYRHTLGTDDNAQAAYDSVINVACNNADLSLRVGFFALAGNLRSDTVFATYSFPDNNVPVIDVQPDSVRYSCLATDSVAAYIQRAGNAVATDACHGAVTWERYTWVSDDRSGNGNLSDNTFDIITDAFCVQTFDITFIGSDACGVEATTTGFVELFLDTAIITVDTPATNLVLDCSDDTKGTQITNWFLDKSGIRASSIVSTVDITPNFSLDSLLNEFGAKEQSQCGDYVIDVTYSLTDTLGRVQGPISAQIIVEDNENPIINTPSINNSISCATSDKVAVLTTWLQNFGGASATDNCTDSLLWTSFTWNTTNRSGQGNFATGPFTNILDLNVCSQTFDFTFEVEDACGNSSTTSASFSVIDTSLVIDAPAADINISCEGLLNNPEVTITSWYNQSAGFKASQGSSTLSNGATKTVQTVIAEYNSSMLDNCNEGMVTVGFFGVDTSGSSTDTSFATFSSFDTIGPVINSMPNNISFDCAAVDSAAVQQWLQTQGGANASDVCSDSIFWTMFSWTSSTGGSGSGNFETGPFTILDGTDCFESAEVTFIVSDPCGNTASVSAQFSIQDTTPLMDTVAPIITNAASDLNVDCSVDITASLQSWYDTFGGLMATDDNGVINLRATKSFSIAQQDFNASDSNSNCANGNVTVGFYALDTLDNSTDTVFASFTAVDTIAPTITVAAQNHTMPCNAGTQDSLTNWIKRFGGAVAQDDCSADDIIWAQFTYRDINANTGSGTFLNGPFNFLPNDRCDWSADVTFRVTDACGNISSTTATFSIEDNEAPVFAFILPDTTLNCDNVPSATALIADDACQGQIMASASDSTTQSDSANTCEFFNYQIFRTYSVSDDCGNMTSFTQTISITDTLEPRFQAPVDITLSCQEDISPSSTGEPINVIDNCASEVQITFSDSEVGSGCSRQIIRTWEIKDLCGSSLILPQTITIKDTIAPIIDSIATDREISCQSIADSDQEFALWIADMGGAQASDECGSSIQTFVAVPGSYDINDPVTFPGQSVGTLDFVSCPSTEAGAFRFENVDFVFVDDCGNAAVTSASFKITDNISPTISGGGQDTVLVLADANACTASIIIPALSIEDACGQVDNSFSVNERYNITSSDFGNELIPVDTINAQFGPIDATVITEGNDIQLEVQMINIDADDPTEFFNIVAEDGTDLGRTPNTPTQCGDTTFILTFTAAQLTNWASDGFVNIDFIPNVPAGLSGALAINDVCFGAGSRLLFNLNIDLEVSGFIDYKIQIDENDPVTLDRVEDYAASLEGGSHAITYLVTDCAGNVSSKTYTIEVKESGLPTISCPLSYNASLPLGVCTNNFSLPIPANATDNCNLSDTFTLSVSGATSIEMAKFRAAISPMVMLEKGENLVTYNAFDKSGNSSNCSFTVTVQDIESPNITCQDTSTAMAHPSGVAPLIIDPATVVASVSDNCEISDYTYSNVDFACNDIGTIQQVTVSVSDASGNTSQCMTNVMIIPFSLEPQAQSLVCTGDTLKLLANVPAVEGNDNPYQFSWSGPNGFTSSLENPVIPNSTPNLSGAYNLLVVGANTCRSAGTVNVVIEDFNMPSISVDTSMICEGDTVTFSATDYQAMVTYKWYSGTAPNGTQIGVSQVATFSHSPSVGEASYYVVAENEACETSPSQSVSVTVNEIPDVVININEIIICERGSFELVSAYEGGPNTSYLWTGPNGYTSTEARPARFENASPDLSGVYSLVVTENGCPSPPATTTVVVNPFPQTPAIQTNNVVCEGDNLILFLTDTVSNTGTLNWLLDGEFYESVQGNGLIIPNANDSLEGLWQVYIQDGPCSSDTSNGVLITVEKQTGISIVNDTLQCEGDEVQLMTNLVQDATYEWSGPNNFRSTLQSPIATIAEGTYKVTVTTEAGCANLAEISFSTTPRPVITSLGEDIVECVDGTNSFVIIPEVGPDTNYTYSWTGPDGFTSSEEILTLSNTTSAQSGTYTLTIANDICNSVPQDFVLTLTDIPNKPDLGTAITACEGEVVTLSVLNHVEGINKYLWTTPLGMFETDGPTFEIPSVSLANAGIYLVSAEENGCISPDSDLLNVNVFTIPRAPGVSSNGPVCAGEDLILQATQIVNAEYRWEGPNAFAATGDRVVIRNTTIAQEGDYSVRIILNGCPSEPSILSDIEFLPKPDKPATELAELDVCADDMESESVILCIDPAVYNPDLTYVWTNQTTDTELGRTSERCLVLSEDSPVLIGENRVSVVVLNDICDSDDSDILSFVLYERLDAIANGGPDIVACDISDVQLSASNPTQGTGRWIALDPGIRFSDDTDPNSLVFDINEGNNILIWQLENGACQGDHDTIVVSTETLAAANDDQIETAYNTEVTFDPIQNDVLPVQYDVQIISDPRKGSITVDADNNITYTPEAGFIGPVEIVYEICSNQCIDNCDRATATIVVGDVTDCFAPSLITPNGDGINDAFVIPCVQSGLYPNSQLFVYNQYGDQVYEATNYDNDWQGQYKGQDLPTGTYYYVFRANSQLAPEKGFLIIER